MFSNGLDRIGQVLEQAPVPRWVFERVRAYLNQVFGWIFSSLFEQTMTFARKTSKKQHFRSLHVLFGLLAVLSHGPSLFNHMFEHPPR